MNKFFIYWLITVSLFVISAGIIFAFVAPYYFPGVQDVFYRSFSGQSIQSICASDKNHIDWIYAVLGGSLAGWGVMILSLSVNLLKENDAKIWNTVLASVATWFVIDTAITLKYMVVANIVLNLFIAIAVAIPYMGNRTMLKKAK